MPTSPSLCPWPVPALVARLGRGWHWMMASNGNPLICEDAKSVAALFSMLCDINRLLGFSAHFDYAAISVAIPGSGAVNVPPTADVFGCCLDADTRNPGSSGWAWSRRWLSVWQRR